MHRDSVPAEDSVRMLAVLPAAALVAVDGANRGDAMAPAEDLAPGDVYSVAGPATLRQLAVSAPGGAGQLRVGAGTQTGRPGAQIHLDCCATFISEDGTFLDILVLVEMEPDGASLARVHLFPLAGIVPLTAYALVAVDRHLARARFAETACAAFTRGTRITMAGGHQVAVERLAAGDAVLTRDHGPQPLRWIGQQTMRASGAFAPIRIARGALNNAEDLVVSPNHRLFVYQRRDRLLPHRAEVLVKARNLLNGTTVTRTEGGFVDYFPLLFDRHEIVFAEGIAAETLLVDTLTRPALPGDADPAAGMPVPRAWAEEVNETHLDAAKAADLLRLSSGS